MDSLHHIAAALPVIGEASAGQPAFEDLSAELTAAGLAPAPGERFLVPQDGATARRVRAFLDYYREQGAAALDWVMVQGPDRDAFLGAAALLSARLLPDHPCDINFPGPLGWVQYLAAHGVEPPPDDLVCSDMVPIELSERFQALASAGLALDDAACPPILTAIGWGNAESLRGLIDAHADSHCRDAQGATFLHIAAMLGSVPTMEALRLNVSVAEQAGNTPLHVAAQHGQMAAVGWLLAQPGVAVNVRRLDGQTPLHVAASRDQVAVIEALLETRGVNVDAADAGGATPLLLAAERGHAAALSVLLEQADVRARDANGSTVLHVAAMSRSAKALAVVVAHPEVVLDARAENGETALMMAVRYRDESAVRALIAAGANVNAADDQQISVLHQAVMTGELGVVRALAAAEQINLDVLDVVGNTPLHVAGVTRQGELMLALVRAGADDLRLNAEGRTALQLFHAANAAF